MSQIEIPKDWDIVYLDNERFFDRISGKTPLKSRSDYWENGCVSWLSGEDISENKINFLNQTAHKITQKAINEKAATLVPKHSIVLSCTATLGKVGIVEKEMTTNQQFNSFVIKQEFDPKFLAYYFLASKESLKKLSTTITFPHITIPKLTKLSIPKPSIKTQRKIVQKLDYILGQLEEKRKQIFSLFEQNTKRIDFFEKHWISYILDNEIKNHPKRKEWKLVKLEKLCSKITDGVHKTPHYVKSGIPFISVRELQNDTINFANCRYISEAEHIELIKHCNPEIDDILLSKTGATIGKLAVIKTAQKFSLFVNTALLKPHKDRINSQFLAMTLKTHLSKKKNLTGIKTSAQPNLPINEIKKLEILLPPLSIQKQIVQNIENAEEKFKSQKTQFENIKENNESRIKYINHIQSSILDSAFSGKLVN